MKKNKGKTKQKKEVALNISHIGKVENLSYSSYGVLKSDGKVIFVPYTVTGDIISYRLLKDKKTFSEGMLIEILNSSPYRRKPLCPYFGKCGGCQWQHVNYEYQLLSKKMITKDLLERIGKIIDPPVKEIIAGESEWYYRNRVRFQIGVAKQDVNFGFAVYNSNEVVDIETCYIIRKPIIEMIKKIREIKEEIIGLYDFEVYYSDLEDKFIFYGITRNVTALNNIRRLPDLFKGGIFFDKKSKRSVTIKNPTLNYRLKTALNNHDIKISAGGFLQANQYINEKVINTLIDEFSNCEDLKLLELYSGCGNFTVPLSKLFKHVVAVEGSSISIQALEENLYKNNIINVVPVNNDVKEEVIKNFHLKKKYDVIFLDPPRSGAKEIITYLPHLGANTIVYLSCNPSTLARDLQILINSGYSLEKVIPFDMFPQTFHIEVLAVLKR
ncbi:MAG: class I SAM-dependent RNA methyltransferase [Proteobacteria bacterium]|nr:class I SAM-dependent RNA methyltransferase [Pseudomonadota bacterium]